MRRLIKITLTTAVATAAISGVAVAQDFRSPDARAPKADGRMSILNGRDLVSPDARDSGRQTNPATDVRSPDARDAANRPVVTYEPGRVAQPGQPVLLVPSTGFNWGDAGIGAAGMLALFALIGGTLMITSHRRRGRGFPVATS